jgi:hypothetical protein
MKKTDLIILSTLLTLLLLVSPASSKADEGMWLISLINKNINDMQRMGLELSAEDIYSINRSSLKDAVVQLDDGGCSAEIISASGLVLTNHHCAVSDIQYHSSATRNLLKEGFWAKSYADELPVPGKTALILKRVENVTDKVLSLVDWNSEDFFEQVSVILENLQNEIEKNERGTHVVGIPMYNHNQFYLFVYNRFTDVRLVGAPPSSIGNFGGDEDNWRWPRHTGDFALFRIYTAPNGAPADYNKRNKPYKPKHHFPVSLEGVNEGDFTMVIGFPGTTYRFSSSFHAAHERDVVAPWVDDVWGDFIYTIKDAMESDVNTKVMYTDTHDMLVNFWQKDTYQAQSMKRFNVVERMAEREKQLVNWSKENPELQLNQIDAIDLIQNYFDVLSKNRYDELFRSLSALNSWPVSVTNNIYELSSLFDQMFANKPSKRKIKKEAKILQKRLPNIFKNFNPDVDKHLYSTALVSLIKNLPADVKDPLLSELSKQEYNEFFIPLLVDQLYSSSIFTSESRFNAFLSNPSIDSLGNDPLFMLLISYETLIAEIQDNIASHKLNLRFASRNFTQGLLSMRSDELLYPDANSTMRLSYGKVAGYFPRDGVYYKHMTYLGGKIDKDDSNRDIFNVPTKIKELWNAKDFGPYADNYGVPICFITDNDITNGNSGSPVLNAKGHLVGVAFDGNYEAMACDFIYEQKMQRTIVTDIRYVLFVIDKYAGAKHLLDEMTIISH